MYVYLIAVEVSILLRECFLQLFRNNVAMQKVHKICRRRIQRAANLVL